MPSLIRSVGHRIYADFFMPSRLDAFEDLLRCLQDAGYTTTSVESFWEREQAGRNDQSPVAVLRHDVDTDPNTARAMWEVEQRVGAQGSFFFRLSTLDVPLMRDIAASRCSASYHYEELATVAKRRRIRTADELARHIPEAQDAFLGNIGHLRSMTGLPMNVVASHGDFINRRLGVPNWVILDDPEFRELAGVELETYDQGAMARVTNRYSDTLHPRYWIPERPEPGIASRSPVIYILVHPRHWRTARLVNARDDLGRVAQALIQVMPTRKRASRRDQP
jgi:hypothetical protein